MSSWQEGDCDEWDYEFEDALIIAYGKYVDECCQCHDDEDCGCMNLKQFEEEFVRDRAEEKIASCDW
jgi:hypothetical protein